MDVALTVDVRVGEGPDGKHWVLLTVSDNLMTATVRVPANSAEALADDLNHHLTEAVAEARRLDSGLVIAGTLPK